MTFEIEIAGRTRVVNVERDGAHHFRVTVDGIAHHLDDIGRDRTSWFRLPDVQVIAARQPSAGLSP